MVEIQYDQIWFQNNIDSFEEWFDKTTYDYGIFSNYLCIYAWRYFDLWWDPDKFNWNESFALCSGFSKKFHIWFNPLLFNWMHIYYLAMYASNEFDKWLTRSNVTIKLVKEINTNIKDKTHLINWINKNINGEDKLAYLYVIK